MGEPQQIDVNVQQSPKIDPQRGDPTWLRIAGQATFGGAVLVLFTIQYLGQAAQTERVIDKVQAMLDKQEERNSKERDREVTRLEKQHQASEDRLREWNKAISERQALEADKVRLELKTMTEQMKLLGDRVRMQTMKD